MVQAVTARTLVLVFLAACGGGDDAPAVDARPSDDFDRNALLAHLSTNVLLPLQANVQTATAALPATLGAYCDALDAGAVGTTLDVARAAFADAIGAWEAAEAALVGPAEMNNDALRGVIYSWPFVSPCELDKDTAARHANPASYSVAAKLVNARSLSAVEFLLYPQNDLHNCAQPPPGFMELGANLPKARCRLALAIATDVAAQAVTLHTAWKADGGDYVGTLANAGRAGSSIPSAHAGLNLVSDAMFYLDKLVKDMKLAEAAGIAVNSCGTVEEPCVREVELRYADLSTRAIRQNLATFRAVFTGEPAAGPAGPGFDDFLIALGHADVAARMTSNIDRAIAAAAALPDSFLTALSTDYAAVVATHAAIRGITDDLKSQFLTLLALEIPDDVAADND